jgi:shikimate kinase
MIRIFLIGMMGVGKTYWSKKCSAQLNIPYYDLDEVIESREKLSIAEIFTQKGEAIFRKIESETLIRFSEKKSFLLAVGGGAPCFRQNMQWMNDNGITIWLDEPVDVLVERLKLGKAHRPLLKHLSDEELYSFLQNKSEERKPFYSQSKYHLFGKEISDESFKKIVYEISQKHPAQQE